VLLNYFPHIVLYSCICEQHNEEFDDDKEEANSHVMVDALYSYTGECVRTFLKAAIRQETFLLSWLSTSAAWSTSRRTTSR